MAQVPAVVEAEDENTLLKVVREIAMDFNEIETVLKNNGISPEQYEKLKSNPYFNSVLKAETAAWNAAHNTNERVKVKAAAMLEEWLPHANMMAHDPSQALNQRVELMKLIRSLTGMGATNAVEGGSEKLSVTINLGGAALRYEKTVQPKVIEGDVTQGE